jgi:hypothetical protein
VSSQRSHDAVPSDVMLPQYVRNLGSSRENMPTTLMGDPSLASDPALRATANIELSFRCTLYISQETS